MTVWLVRIWTHRNADEKAHTLSRKSKNVKKRTKTYEKRMLCKFTFRRICAAKIRLSFDCMPLPFLFICIYIEKVIMRISAQKIRVIGKIRLTLHLLTKGSKQLTSRISQSLHCIINNVSLRQTNDLPN